MADKNKQSEKRKSSGFPYSFATVNDKGQIVIPKETRDWLNIETGDKLLLFHREPQGDRKMKSLLILTVDDAISSVLMNEFLGDNIKNVISEDDKKIEGENSEEKEK